jgi:hypothetical protein
MLEIIGTIDKQDVGIGTWALSADDGQVYELKNLPADVKHQGMRVMLTGIVLEDVMSIAMIGPVFEVDSCTKL